MNTHAIPNEEARGFLIKGIVQGVGFRPTLKRWAQEHSLVGYTRNTSHGLEVSIWGVPRDLDAFEEALSLRPPALSRIDQIDPFVPTAPRPGSFDAHDSTVTDTHTLAISPDVGMCEECESEIFDPLAHRFRYPFTNCTNCGPRFTIIREMPYDRVRTSMAEFDMCPMCLAEYEDTQDRRCHAQPIACYHCGPMTNLRRLDGHVLCIDSFTQTDELDAVCTLIKSGAIVAIKGIGGFHLACDATNESTVAHLRARKQRPDKPLALMARDEAVVRRYADLGDLERELLRAKEKPIVLLNAKTSSTDTLPVAANVAPQQNVLGFMLPYTPLHALIMRRMDRPVVMTSGNLSDEPQCLHAQDVETRLSNIAEYIVDHNRPIERRIDDSVVRVIDKQPRVVRRARGYAPANLPLPEGFNDTPSVMALGGDLKNTFCLLGGTGAVLSHHIGELANPFVHDDYVKAIDDLTRLFTFTPEYLVADTHPDYYSNKHTKGLAAQHATPLIEAQHHHAHVASCLFENAHALDAAPVLGIVLDGLGYWEGELCGGEFVRADYTQCTRLGTFKPVALPGREKAMVEPWRNTAAHLLAETSWSALKMNFEPLELIEFLAERSEIQAILESPHAPRASSAGRLFDAVAAAVGICRESISFEGQAAMALEAIVDQDVLDNEDPLLAYPFAIPNLPDTGMPYIEPLAMWQALLGDLILKTPPATIAARFHKGLAQVIVQMAATLADKHFDSPPTIALSGGVWQNKTLTERVSALLKDKGFNVLQHTQVPTNDGGLALGQASIGAAAVIKHVNTGSEGETTACV